MNDLVTKMLFTVGVLLIASLASACDDFDRVSCVSVGAELRDFEEETSAVISPTLYDPSWFVSSSDCWQNGTQRDCAGPCLVFAEQLNVIIVDYHNGFTGDGGPLLARPEPQ